MFILTDVIYDLDLGISDSPTAILFDQPRASKKLDDIDGFVDLLQPIFRDGNYVADTIDIHTIRKHAIFAVNEFFTHWGKKSYPVGLEEQLHRLKQQLMETFRSTQS